MAELTGSNLRPAPTRRLITSVATANLRLSLSPISASVGRARQQVLMLQEPETPWHLHCVSKLDSTAYRKVRHAVTTHSTLKFLSPTNAPRYYTHKMLKYTVKISHDCSYMFRSTWTIIREPMPNLGKVTVLWRYSVKIRR